MFSGPFDYSILKRAKEKKIVEIEIINIREFGIGPHKVVDDTTYGGGVGMVMKVDVLKNAIEYTKNKSKNSDKKCKTFLLSAAGFPFKQNIAKKFSDLDHLILICGHYEGVDERILQFIDGEITIGDYVLTGGELPAMIITDSVVRLLDGVITKGATEDESFTMDESRLEYPQFTKPQVFEGHGVPEVLLSGNHKDIANWRNDRAIEKTKQNRPDLLSKDTNK